MSKFAYQLTEGQFLQFRQALLVAELALVNTAADCAANGLMITAKYRQEQAAQVQAAIGATAHDKIKLLILDTPS